MAFIHSKNTVVKWDANDLSVWTDSTDFNDGVGTEKTTTYGPTRTRESYGATLGDGKVTCKGTSDDGAGAPGTVLPALMDAGEPVTFTFWPKGAGAGKPSRVVEVLITAYNESAPVSGYSKWTCEMQMTGAINRANQA